MSGIFTPSEQTTYGKREKRLLVEDCLHIPTLPETAEQPLSYIEDLSSIYYKDGKLLFWNLETSEFNEIGSGYLPLTAGIEFPVTGELFLRDKLYLYDELMEDYMKIEAGLNSVWFSSPGGNGGIIFSFGEKTPIFNGELLPEGLIDPIYTLPDDTGTLALAEKTMSITGSQVEEFRPFSENNNFYSEIYLSPTNSTLYSTSKNVYGWSQVSSFPNSVNAIAQSDDGGGYASIFNVTPLGINTYKGNDAAETIFRVFDDNEFGGLDLISTCASGQVYLVASVEENFIFRKMDSSLSIGFQYNLGEFGIDYRSIDSGNEYFKRLLIPIDDLSISGIETIATREWVESEPITLGNGHWSTETSVATLIYDSDMESSGSVTVNIPNVDNEPLIYLASQQYVDNSISRISINDVLESEDFIDSIIGFRSPVSFQKIHLLSGGSSVDLNSNSFEFKENGLLFEGNIPSSSFKGGTLLHFSKYRNSTTSIYSNIYLPEIESGNLIALNNIDNNPKTPTSPGKKGQVVYNGTQRFECINDNVWVRTIVETTW